MADFEDNWGLQAIVRGSSTMRRESCFMDDHDNDMNGGGFFFGFPGEEDDGINLFQTNVDMRNDDLQQFYKPFYPVSDSSSSPAVHVPAAVVKNGNENKDEEPPLPHVLHHKKQLNPQPDQSGASCSTDATPNIAQTPKYRKRKNQNKRVVVQAIGTEGLPSDMWAWRKYGQKPIKGSPFPRFAILLLFLQIKLLHF
uniref:WRKY5 n=1 Tax=Gentiana crassa subsp. rigescens TaxID=3097545 RepID=W8FQM8_9GENT|nr:WRKY5 [Gentiana rigescens]